MFARKVDFGLFKIWKQELETLQMEVSNLTRGHNGLSEEFLRCMKDTREALLNNQIETCEVCGKIGVRHKMEMVPPTQCEDERFIHSKCRANSEFDRRKEERRDEQV